MAGEPPGIEASGPTGAIAIDRATTRLAGILEPGEEIRYATSAPVGTLDTLLGPFTVAVTDRRIIVARRSWLGKARRVAVSQPLPATIKASVRPHGSAVRIGESRRWLYVRPQVAADLERLAGGDTQPAAGAAQDDSPHALKHDATRARLQNGVRTIRYVRIGAGVILLLVALLRFLGGANGGSTTVPFSVPTVPTTAFPTTTPSTATVPQNTGTTALAFGDGALWSTDGNDNMTLRIDPASGRAVAHIASTDGDPVAVAVGAGGVWVANSNDSTVTRIDPQSNRALGASITARNTPVALVAGDGAVWVADGNGGGVSRIDPVSNAPAGAEISVGSFPLAIALTPDAVWVTNYADGTVSRIDPATGRVVGNPITTGGSPDAIAAGAGGVWIADSIDGSVSEIDPATGRVVGAPITVGADPQAIAASATEVFVADYGPSTISIIDPRTHAVHTIAVGPDPSALAVGDGALWVGNAIDVRVQRLRVVAVERGSGREVGVDLDGVLRRDVEGPAVAHRDEAWSSPAGSTSASTWYHYAALSTCWT